MRIEKITLIHLRVPLKKPFFSASGLVKEKEFLLLKAVSGNSVGWGEVSPETVSFDELMLDYKRNLVPFALQMPFDDIEDFGHSLSVMKASPEARAGLEMAAWNLLLQSRGETSSQAVPDQEMRSVSIGKILRTGDESEIAESLKLALDAGQTPVVLKVNPKNVQTIAAVLRNFEKQMPIILDAEGSFSVETAGDLKQFPDQSVQFVIDPISSENWEDVRLLQANLNFPIALKNSLTDILEVEKMAQTSFVDAVFVDPWRVGGLMTAARYLTIASENTKPAYAFSQLHLDIGTIEALVFLSFYTKNKPIFATVPEEVFGTKFISDSLLHFQGNLVQLPATTHIHFNGIETQLDRFRVTEEEYW